MTSEQMVEMNERMEATGIGLRDKLALMEMMGVENEAFDSRPPSPYEAFEGLHRLINQTVHGAKIQRFKPIGDRKRFHTFEIHSEEGETLGYLNMMYLKKGIPCYYLVYVEVTPPFRRMGLGHRILKAFMTFLEEKKAVGLLDNIIPPEEATYEIYTKLGWKPLREIVAGEGLSGRNQYMVFIPESVPNRNPGKELIRILFTLGKRRPVIDMHDNEDMVRRAINEFRSVYGALIKIFKTEIDDGISTPLMRFMFTRLTTKLLGFRRRITQLIGYTGGESLEQITFSEAIKELPIQPYSIWGKEAEHAQIWGDAELLQRLPKELRKEPTLFIESLPLYKRPYLSEWIKRGGDLRSPTLRISDLLTLGFDPTRLREFHHEGVTYIFERVSPHLCPSLIRRRKFLNQLEPFLPSLRILGSTVQINPPVGIFQDRGNVYALRKKVAGIHSQEALDQLQGGAHLKAMNQTLGLESMLSKTIHEVERWLRSRLHLSQREEVEDLAYFVPWDIEMNLPRLHVYDTGIGLETLWIA